MAMYRAMRAHFGPLHWWPSQADAESPAGKLEICLGAILTQNTAWTNVETALANLRSAGLIDLAALARTDNDTLATLIRPAGYYNLKARRLRAFIDHVRTTTGRIDTFFDRPIDTLRPKLLGVYGIGPETADSMLLYAGGKRTFVVDAYTLRIFSRHGLIAPRAEYETVRQLCQQNLPPEVGVYNDYHAQLVMIGKDFCKPSPRCEHCPLRRFPRPGLARPRKSCG